MSGVLKNWRGEVLTLSNVQDGVRPGWHEIVRKLVADLHAIGWDGTVAQVKEKFGTLRFYTGPLPEGGRELINDAEIASSETCEVCGCHGKLRYDRSWLKTLCDDHNNPPKD